MNPKAEAKRSPSAVIIDSRPAPQIKIQIHPRADFRRFRVKKGKKI